MDGINGISKNTYEQMPDSDKLNVLFDCLLYICQEHRKRRVQEYIIAGGTGLVGGVSAVLAKFVFWGNK